MDAAIPNHTETRQSIRNGLKILSVGANEEAMMDQQDDVIAFNCIGTYLSTTFSVQE